jgi:cytosine/adenosine deaminase-related metal-dependent hydrolase
VVEDVDAILAESRSAVERHHDPVAGSMRQVVIAPCSPFSVTADLLAETAALSRSLGVRMHTHLAETADEEEFCLGRFGRRPVEYMEDLGWAGGDVWYAHAVHVADDEVARMGSAGTGVAHCATSNMRLASGVAPVGRYLEAGVIVGLGVDGSASNDSSNMLAETRQAMLLSRVAAAPGPGSGATTLMTARDALRLATRGGAEVLGRQELGRLVPGSAADFIAVDLERLEYAGALHDPVAAVVMCHGGRVDHSWVGGQRLVDDGHVVGVDDGRLLEDHNRLAMALVD